MKWYSFCVAIILFLVSFLVQTYGQAIPKIDRNKVVKKVERVEADKKASTTSASKKQQKNAKKKNLAKNRNKRNKPNSAKSTTSSESSTTSSSYQQKGYSNKTPSNNINKSKTSQQDSYTYLDVSEQYICLSASGGTKRINVRTNKEWSTSALIYPWIHLTKDGNTLVIRIDANNSYSDREDYFYVRAGGEERRVYITQNAKERTNNSYGSTYGSNSNNTYNSYGSYSSSYYSGNPHKKWWKENFSVGISGDFEINADNKTPTMYYSAGLLFRFGQPNHLFNVITGVKYRWINVKLPQYNKSDGYYSSGKKYRLLGGFIGIPLNCRFNFFSVGDRSAIYLGAGGEYGIRMHDKTYDIITNKYYLSVSPHIGYTSRHFDIDFYYKYYIKDPISGINNWRGENIDTKDIFGMQMNIFF